MIPIQELLFTLDTKVNNLSNLKGQYIPDETKIEVLNISQLKLVLGKIDADNIYQAGMDSFSKRYQDLQTLQVPYEKLTVTPTGDLLNSYIVPYTALSQNMLVPVTGYVTANKGNCKGRILDIIVDMKHTDIRMLLKSPHYTPSFQYQETLGSMSDNSIYVYSDGTFTIDTLYLSYLRYPVQMDVAGYIHLNNAPSTNVDCELEYYLMNELLDLAVQEIADATGDQSKSQTSRARSKQDE